MAWVRFDDGTHEEERFGEAGCQAAGLMLFLLAYSNRNLRDGFVAAPMLRKLAEHKPVAPLRLVDFLMAAGLLKRCKRDGIEGFQIHKDFVQLQPTKEQVERERQANKDRQASFRDKHRNGLRNAVTNAVTGSVTNGSVTDPSQRPRSRSRSRSRSRKPEERSGHPRSTSSVPTSGECVTGRGPGEAHTRASTNGRTNLKTKVRAVIEQAPVAIRGLLTDAAIRGCGLLSKGCFGPCDGPSKGVCFPLDQVVTWAKPLDADLELAVRMLASFRDHSPPREAHEERHAYRFWQARVDAAVIDPDGVETLRAQLTREREERA